MKRVVVTGMAALTPIGNDWNTVETRLRARRTQIAATDVEQALRASLRRHDGRAVPVSRVARKRGDDASVPASRRNAGNGSTSVRKAAR